MALQLAHPAWLDHAAHAEIKHSYAGIPCDVLELYRVDAVYGSMVTLRDSSGKVAHNVPAALLQPTPPTIVLPEPLQPCTSVDARLEDDSSQLWGCTVVQQCSADMVLVLEYGSLTYHTVPRASLRISQVYDPANSSWALREVPLVCRCLIDQSCGHNHTPPQKAMQQKLHFVGVKKNKVKDTWQSQLMPSTVPATPPSWPFPLWSVDPKHHRTAFSCSQAVAAWLADQVVPATKGQRDQQQQHVGINYGDEVAWGMVVQHLGLTGKDVERLQTAAARAIASVAAARQDKVETAGAVQAKQGDTSSGQLQDEVQQSAGSRLAARTAAGALPEQPNAMQALYYASSTDSQHHHQHYHHHHHYHHECQEPHHEQQQQQQQQSALPPSVNSGAGPRSTSAAAAQQITQQQQAQGISAAPAISVGAVLPPTAAAANEHQATSRQQEQQQQQQQKQKQAMVAAPALPAAASQLPIADAAAKSQLAQQQQQQLLTELAFGAAAPAASAVTEDFAVGTQLRVWEQVDMMWCRKFTKTVYEFTSKGCVGQGGNAEAYLVQLDEIVQPEAHTAAAAADCGVGQPAAALAPAAAAAAARKRGRKALPGLQVGGLYVLKVCRLLQDLTAEERGSVAADDVNKYLHRVRMQLLGEQACYGRLVDSPSFVRCFAYGTADRLVAGAAAAPPQPEQERPCLLLEYGQGCSAAALLQTAGGQPRGLSEEQARAVLLVAAEGLQACHRKRIIYKDVQPGNFVLFQAQSEEWTFKMIDCGSSTRMDEGLGWGHLFGLWAYRAPEQREGCYHHYTIDTWQLGMLLMHLRTGELPLPELQGLPKEEWLSRVTSVHKDIKHCEQHPYLQRYMCLSHNERELVSRCLVPDANARPMVERVFSSCDYFQLEGLEYDAGMLRDLAGFIQDTGAVGNNLQGKV